MISLQQYVRDNGPADLRTATRVIAEVASQLHALHGRAKAHRDVRPSQIVIRENGRAYLHDATVALEPLSGAFSVWH